MGTGWSGLVGAENVHIDTRKSSNRAALYDRATVFERGLCTDYSAGLGVGGIPLPPARRRAAEQLLHADESVHVLRAGPTFEKQKDQLSKCW